MVDHPFKRITILLCALCQLSTPAIANPTSTRLHFIFPSNTKSILLGCDRMTVYVVHDAKPIHGKVIPKFRGYVIDKTIKIRSASGRKAIVQAVMSAVTDPTASEAECFMPGFAIRVDRGSKRLDLLICFDCHSVETFSGNSFGRGPISNLAFPCLQAATR